MFKSNLPARSLRAALLTGAATATVFAFIGPVAAQEAGTETVVITGSRIPQTGLVSVSPVSTVGQQELKLQGTTNIDTLINSLPSVFAAQTNTLTNGGTGTATLSLRGLGSVRTLVLVNGRRLMPGDPFLPAPDVNTIPPNMVERVEVLTGGASAVYGSDAVAGVVNFIMRKDFEGIEVNGQYSVFNTENDCGFCHDILEKAKNKQAPSNPWDGDGEDTSVIMGANTANGKGNVTAWIGFHHNEPIFQSERDFSACSFAPVGLHDFRCGGSSNKFRIISLDTGKQFYGGSTVWVPYGSVPNNSAGRLFNYGPFNTFQRPDTRWTAGFFAHYEVEPWLEAYTEFMFMDDRSKGSIAPSGLFLGAGFYSGVTLINCDNPLMTAQQRALLCPFAGQQDASVLFGRRNIEGGTRDFDLHHEAFRDVVGIRGDLGDGWAYDIYAQYGKTNFSSLSTKDWSKERSQNALLVDPATGDCFRDAANCVPLDLFHGFGAITQEMLDYVNLVAITQGFTEEKVVSASLTGDLGSIGFISPWAKNPVAVAIGGEYRSEGIEIDPDDPSRFGDGTGSGGKTTPQPFASFHVHEVFAEARVPIIEDAPWAKLLQVNGAYRYSSYSTAGSVNTYSYGAEWQPIDDFRLRATYQRAVRAPNVLELFSPQNIVLTDGTFNDPCFDTPAAFGNCAAATGGASLHGTPPGDTLLSCPASQCNQLVGGNTNLKPETADTRSAGIVLTPTFIPGFSATIDYFNIKISNAISTIGAQSILNGCYLDNNAADCALVHRNSFGAVYGSGFVTNINANIGGFKVKGFDFEANYQTDLADWDMGNNGSIGVNFLGTWMQSYNAGTECAGFYGCALLEPQPKWRHKLRVTWSSPWDVDLSAQWRHFAGVKLKDGDGLEPLDEVDYIDLSAVWHVWDNVELRGGVDNVFDKRPPLTAFAGTAPGNGNTFPGLYDALGRFIFIGGTVKM